MANVVVEAAGFKAGQSMAGGIGWQEECAATLAAQCSGTEPTVCVKCYDGRGNGDGRTVSTLTGDHENRITDYTSVVVERAYSLQGNTIDRNAKQNGSGISENVAHTLNAVDRHGVCFCIANGQANAEMCADKSPCLNCNHEQPIVFGEEVHDIVRRLTPIECARLQGFPDNWGEPDQKDDFTEEEYRFWLDVRNTHAAINGKEAKEYTKPQMLIWYNKLHTDSAEYKMWGNGIALPPALYCMQGMVEAMRNEIGG